MAPQFYTDDEFIWNEFMKFCKRSEFTFNEKTTTEYIKSVLNDWRLYIKKTNAKIRDGKEISNYWYNCTVDTLQEIYEKIFKRSLNLTSKRCERHVKKLLLTQAQFEKMVNCWSEDNPEGLQVKFYLCASLSLKWSNYEAYLCTVSHFQEELLPDGTPTGRIAYNFHNFGENVIQTNANNNVYKQPRYLEPNKLNPNLCPVRLYRKFISRRLHLYLASTQKLFLKHNSNSSSLIWYLKKPIKPYCIFTWKAASAVRTDLRNFNDFRECIMEIVNEYNDKMGDIYMEEEQTVKNNEKTTIFENVQTIPKDNQYLIKPSLHGKKLLIMEEEEASTSQVPSSPEIRRQNNISPSISPTDFDLEEIQNRLMKEQENDSIKVENKVPVEEESLTKFVVQNDQTTEVIHMSEKGECTKRNFPFADKGFEQYKKIKLEGQIEEDDLHRLYEIKFENDIADLFEEETLSSVDNLDDFAVSALELNSIVEGESSKQNEEQQLESSESPLDPTISDDSSENQCDSPAPLSSHTQTTFTPLQSPSFSTSSNDSAMSKLISPMPELELVAFTKLLEFTKLAEQEKQKFVVPELVRIRSSREHGEIATSSNSVISEVPELVPICRCRKNPEKPGEVHEQDMVRHKLTCFNRGRNVSNYMLDVIRKFTNSDAITLSDMLAMKFDLEDEYKTILIRFFVGNSMQYVLQNSDETDRNFFTNYRNFIRVRSSKYFNSTKHEQFQVFLDYYKNL